MAQRLTYWRRFMPAIKNLTDLTRLPAQTLTRAGLPKAVAPAGTSRLTTLRAPTTVSSLLETPGRMIAAAPI
jgi:hypothetical protein